MSPPESSDQAATARRGSPALWFAVFGAPAAWFLSLVVGYFTVHEACRHQSALAPMVISLVALGISVTAGIGGRTLWRRTEYHERTRFMAEIGMMSGIVFSLIILLQVVAMLLLPACHERPRTPASPDVFQGPSVTFPVV